MKRDQHIVFFFNLKTKRNRYRQICFQKRQNGKAKIRQSSKQTLFKKNISEDFLYGSSYNHYRRHREYEITPVSEQEEDEMSDHYTEIPSYQEEEMSEQYFDPISEFELSNENQSSDLNFDELYIDQNNTTDLEYRFPLIYDKVFFVKNSTCIDENELAKKIQKNQKLKMQGNSSINSQPSLKKLI